MAWADASPVGKVKLVDRGLPSVIATSGPVEYTDWVVSHFGGGLPVVRWGGDP